MNKNITILAVALAAQLGLFAVLRAGSSDLAPAGEGKALLSFDAGKLDRLVLEEPGKPALTLTKAGEEWQIEEAEGFLTEPGRVKALVDRLAELKPRIALGTSEEAAERFKVGKENHTRRITLRQGESVLATLYLGNGSGPKRSYARAEGQNAVYEVELAAWEAGVTANDWMRRDYLQLPEAKITRVELGGLVLEKQEGQWRLPDLAAGEQMASEAESTVHRLATLGFTEVLGKAGKPQFAEPPAFTAKLTLEGGEERSFSFIKQKEGSDYAVKPSNGEYYVKVGSYAVDPLKGLERSKLVKSEPPAPAATNLPAAVPVPGTSLLMPSTDAPAPAAQ